MTGSPTAARPPRYIDALLADFAVAPGQRFNHLGHWDDPEGDVFGVGRERAQARMVEIVAGLANVAPLGTVIDAGSGFGGTAAWLEAHHAGLRVIGIDIDARQLATCRDLRATNGGELLWVQGDACALPLPSGCVDAIISIEAMWHLPSREVFLAEAARVLRPGARIAAVDLVVERSAPDELGRSSADLHELLQQAFAPWPNPFVDLGGLRQHAAGLGLRQVAEVDATDATRPTFLDHGDGSDRPGASAFAASEAVRTFVELHRQGLLRVVYLAFERTDG